MTTAQRRNVQWFDSFVNLTLVANQTGLVTLLNGLTTEGKKGATITRVIMNLYF